MGAVIKMSWFYIFNPFLGFAYFSWKELHWICFYNFFIDDSYVFIWERFGFVWFIMVKVYQKKERHNGELKIWIFVLQCITRTWLVQKAIYLVYFLFIFYVFNSILVFFFFFLVFFHWEFFQIGFNKAKKIIFYLPWWSDHEFGHIVFFYFYF